MSVLTAWSLGVPPKLVTSHVYRNSLLLSNIGKGDDAETRRWGQDTGEDFHLGVKKTWGRSRTYKASGLLKTVCFSSSQLHKEMLGEQRVLGTGETGWESRLCPLLAVTLGKSLSPSVPQFSHP